MSFQNHQKVKLKINSKTDHTRESTSPVLEECPHMQPASSLRSRSRLEPAPAAYGRQELLSKPTINALDNGS